MAGYACQPGFSPDGRYVYSGDGEGRLWFWDWKTCKAFRTIKAHDGVCIGAAWHPLETSKVGCSAPCMQMHACLSFAWCRCCCRAWADHDDAGPDSGSITAQVATCGWDGQIKYWD